MDTAAPVLIGNIPVRPIEATPLTVPAPWKPWHPYGDLLMVEVPKGWADARFGPPSIDDPAGDGLGHETWWGFAFPCGLRCVFRLLRHSPGSAKGLDWLTAYPDIGEPEHIVRHLDVPREWVTWDRLRIPDETDPAVAEVRARQQSWAIWRQDDNGHQLVAGYGASENDAKCLADAFERRAHKQMYWVEKREGDAGAAPVRRRE